MIAPDGEHELRDLKAVEISDAPPSGLLACVSIEPFRISAYQHLVSGKVGIDLR